MFIKSEGSKHQPRERYIITKIDNDNATIQKMNNLKFMSKKYEVPLCKIFPAIKDMPSKESKVLLALKLLNIFFSYFSYLLIVNVILSPWALILVTLIPEVEPLVRLLFGVVLLSKVALFPL